MKRIFPCFMSLALAVLLFITVQGGGGLTKGIRKGFAVPCLPSCSIAVQAAERPDVLVTDDPALVALDTEDTEPFHSEKVLIDLKTGETVTGSGEETSLQEVFSVSKQEEESLTSGSRSENREAITEYLNGEGLYQIEEEGKDRLLVTFPYAFKRILVFVPEGTLSDSFGADKVCYYSLSGMYILDYPSEAAAKEACDHLSGIYGRENVMPDIPLGITEIQSESSGRVRESSAMSKASVSALPGDAPIRTDPFTQTPAVSVSWGNDLMQLDQVRDEIAADAAMKNTVKVAVLDTGINENHLLFAGRIAQGGKSFVVDGSPGDSTLSDENGHGTHVAGIIADGTPQQVQILPVKMMDKGGTGGFGEMINGMNYALSQNADVINLSLGSSMKEYIPRMFKSAGYLALEKAFAEAEKSGCLCVTAAGNAANNQQYDIDKDYVYPAMSPYTIAVSSISSSKTLSSSSNYGNSIDFTAPGVSIRSASNEGTDKYITRSGTSMATPHISAVCAILSLFHKDAENEDIVEMMKQMTVDLGETGKDPFYGNGLVVFDRESVKKFLVMSDSPSGEKETNAGTDPVGPDSVITDPVTTDPTGLDPGSPASVITDPTGTDPGSTDSVITDPVTTDSTGSGNSTQSELSGSGRNDNKDNTGSTQKKTVIKSGTKVVAGGQTYVVTKAAGASSPGTVSLTKAGNAKTIVIPASIRLADKKKYTVTCVDSRAFTGGKIRTVTLGAGIRTIKKNAFAKSRAAKLILKSKKLKKASVKGSLRGSKVKKIHVRAGDRVTNKKLIKKYKKIFTKNNAGARVKIS